MTAKEKNKLAGIFLLAHGGFLALIYFVMVVVFGVVLNLDPNTPKGIAIFFPIFMAIISFLFVSPQIIGGWKMLKEHPNAKNWGIASAILACLNAPLGTAAGVFALIFLFSNEGDNFFNNLKNPNYLSEMNQMDDFQYQNYQQQQQREPHSWR